MVVPLVLASETGCPMSVSAAVIAPRARTAATTTAAASAAHLRPRGSAAGCREGANSGSDSLADSDSGPSTTWARVEASRVTGCRRTMRSWECARRSECA